MKTSEVYASAVLIGALAGMRSMSAPAVLGKISQNGGFDDLTGPLSFVGGASFLPVSGALAIGEMVADKLPFTPNRTAVGPLLGRAFIGAFSGAVVCSAKKRSWLAGALIGAAAAVGAAYAAYEFRRQIGMHAHLPDPVIALGEDALVGGLGLALASRF
jgi:uncharacterized membrane protein